MSTFRKGCGEFMSQSLGTSSIPTWNRTNAVCHCLSATYHRTYDMHFVFLSSDTDYSQHYSIMDIKNLRIKKRLSLQAFTVFSNENFHPEFSNFRCQSLNCGMAASNSPTSKNPKRVFFLNQALVLAFSTLERQAFISKRRILLNFSQNAANAKLKVNVCTLWHNPRRIANFLTSLQFKLLRSHSYLFFTNTSSHFQTREWTLHDWFDCPFSGTPSIKFKAAAIDRAFSSALIAAAITAWRTCLKARTIISWIQRDCTCDNFSESLTWSRKRNSNDHSMGHVQQAVSSFPQLMTEAYNS